MWGLPPARDRMATACRPFSARNVRALHTVNVFAVSPAGDGGDRRTGPWHGRTQGPCTTMLVMASTSDTSVSDVAYVFHRATTKAR